MEAMHNLRKRACYLVHSSNLAITTPWLPIHPNYRPMPQSDTNINISVKDLWWPNTKVWNERMVKSIFIEEDAERVIELKVPQHGEEELVWLLEASGQFSVKSFFHA